MNLNYFQDQFDMIKQCKDNDVIAAQLSILKNNMEQTYNSTMMKVIPGIQELYNQISIARTESMMCNHEEKKLKELQAIKKELQDIRSILEQKEIKITLRNSKGIAQAVTTSIQEHQSLRHLNGLKPIV